MPPPESSSNPPLPQPARTMVSRVNRLCWLLIRSLFVALVLVVIAAYVFFCPPVVSRFFGHQILYPYPPGQEYQIDAIDNIKREDVWFTNANGDKLHGWFFQSPSAHARLVLFTHGNAGNIGHRIHLAKCLLDGSASVLLFDYRGFGKSTGQLSISGMAEDAEAAYDYLTETRKIPPNRIVLYGESIGGGAACWLVERKPVAGIILDSSFTSLMRVAKKRTAVLRLYPDFLQPSPAFNNISVLAGHHPPLLIVHGQQDEIIPHSEAEDNFKSASEPKVMLSLQHSTHNNKGPDLEIYAKSIKSFLESLDHS